MDITYVTNFYAVHLYKVDFYVKNKEVTYIDSFGVEHIPKETKKNVKENVFRIQTCDSIAEGYSCIGIIDFMLDNKWLIDFLIYF